MSTALAPGQVQLVYRRKDDTLYEPSIPGAFYHSAPHKVKMFGGAVGGTKTTTLCAEAIALSWETPHNAGVIGRRDFDDLRRTTYAELLEWLNPALLHQHNKSEHWLRLICPLHPGEPCGSIIHFLELKDSGALKNINLGWYAIDQAEEVPFESVIWLNTRLRLAHVPRRVALFSANPAPGWLKERFVDRGQAFDTGIKRRTGEPLIAYENDEGALFVPALPSDNPHLPDDYVPNLYRDLPEEYARALVEGNWNVTIGAIYPQLSRWHVQKVPEGLTFEDASLGADFGAVHPSALVALQRDGYGRLWVRRCWAGSGDVDGIMNAFKRMASDYGIRHGRTDPNQDVLAQLLSGSDRPAAQRYTFKRAEGGAGSREARIGMVSRLLNPLYGPNQNLRAMRKTDAEMGPWPSELTLPGLMLDADGEGIEDLYRELQAYRWEERRLGARPQPVRQGEDRVAALEYAVEDQELARLIASGPMASIDTIEDDKADPSKKADPFKYLVTGDAQRQSEAAGYGMRGG